MVNHPLKQNTPADQHGGAVDPFLIGTIPKNLYTVKGFLGPNHKRLRFTSTEAQLTRRIDNSITVCLGPVKRHVLARARGGHFLGIILIPSFCVVPARGSRGRFQV